MAALTGTSRDSQIWVFLASKGSRTLQGPGEHSITKEGSTLSPSVLRDGKLNDIILQILSGSWHHWRESLRAWRTIHLKGSHGLQRHTGKTCKSDKIHDVNWPEVIRQIPHGTTRQTFSCCQLFLSLRSNPWDGKPSQRLSSGCAKWIPGADYSQWSLLEA